MAIHGRRLQVRVDNRDTMLHTWTFPKNRLDLEAYEDPELRAAHGGLHNLCVHPAATVTVGGVPRRVRAHEASGEERQRLWQRDLEVYPGRAADAQPATHRRIPVVVLAPVSDTPG
jgi:hypothetical protein